MTQFDAIQADIDLALREYFESLVSVRNGKQRRKTAKNAILTF